MVFESTIDSFDNIDLLVGLSVWNIEVGDGFGDVRNSLQLGVMQNLTYHFSTRIDQVFSWWLQRLLRMSFRQAVTISSQMGDVAGSDVATGLYAGSDIKSVLLVRPEYRRVPTVGLFAYPRIDRSLIMRFRNAPDFLNGAAACDSPVEFLRYLANYRPQQFDDLLDRLKRCGTSAEFLAIRTVGMPRHDKDIYDRYTQYWPWDRSALLRTRINTQYPPRTWHEYQDFVTNSHVDGIYSWSAVTIAGFANELHMQVVLRGTDRTDSLLMVDETDFARDVSWSFLPMQFSTRNSVVRMSVQDVARERVPAFGRADWEEAAMSYLNDKFDTLIAEAHTFFFNYTGEFMNANDLRRALKELLTDELASIIGSRTPGDLAGLSELPEIVVDMFPHMFSEKQFFSDFVTRISSSLTSGEIDDVMRDARKSSFVDTRSMTKLKLIAKNQKQLMATRIPFDELMRAERIEDISQQFRKRARSEYMFAADLTDRAFLKKHKIKRVKDIVSKFTMSPRLSAMNKELIDRVITSVL